MLRCTLDQEGSEDEARTHGQLQQQSCKIVALGYTFFSPNCWYLLVFLRGTGSVRLDEVQVHRHMLVFFSRICVQLVISETMMYHVFVAGLAIC